MGTGGWAASSPIAAGGGSGPSSGPGSRPGRSNRSRGSAGGRGIRWQAGPASSTTRTTGPECRECVGGRYADFGRSWAYGLKRAGPFVRGLCVSATGRAAGGGAPGTASPGPRSHKLDYVNSWR